MNLGKVKDFFKNLGQGSRKAGREKSIEQPKEPTRLEKLEQYRDEKRERISQLKIHCEKTEDLIKQGRKELKPQLNELVFVMKKYEEELEWYENEIAQEQSIHQLEEESKRLEEEQAKYDEILFALRQLSEKREELLGEIKELEKEQREWKVLAQKGNPKAQSKLEKINADLEQLQSQLVHIEGAIETEAERMDDEIKEETEGYEEL